MVIAGYLASMVVSAIEGAVLVGGVSALGAALFNAGVPKDHVIHYETAVQAEGFLVMAHGPAEEMARARDILHEHKPLSVDLHEGAGTASGLNMRTRSQPEQHKPCRLKSGLRDRQIGTIAFDTFGILLMAGSRSNSCLNPSPK